MRRTLQTRNTNTTVSPTKKVVAPSQSASSQKKSKVKPVPNFSRLHKQWDDKFQKGKACTKKPCTVSVGANAKDTPTALQEQVQDEVFDNVVPEKPPGDVGATQTPVRQSMAPERVRVCMTDCPPRFSRTCFTMDAHHRAHLALTNTPQDKENKNAPSVFGSCVVGIPQRQSIYHRYVHTGLLGCTATPTQDTSSPALLRGRVCKSENKARRVPRVLSPSKASSGTPSGAQRTPRDPSDKTHSARRRLPGADRLALKSPARTPTWGQLLAKGNAPKKDALATTLFTDDKENTPSTSPEHQLMPLEELEAKVYKDSTDENQPRSQSPAPSRSVSRSPSSLGGTPTKRQRSVSAEIDLENMKEYMGGTPTKRSKVVKEKRAILGELSPNTYLRRDAISMSPKHHPKSPMSMKNLKSPLSPLALSGDSSRLRPYEGPSSPRQAWAVTVEEDKENLAPVRGGLNSPKHTPMKMDVANLSVDDLNQSLSESLLEMENLESEATKLKRKSNGLFMEDSILQQMEEIKKKQERLTKIQQQLMLQLKLTRSGSSAKKSKRHRHINKSPQKLSPLVEKSSLSSTSSSGSECSSDDSSTPTELIIPKPKKKVTFSDPDTSPPLTRRDEIQSCSSNDDSVFSSPSVGSSVDTNTPSSTKSSLADKSPVTPVEGGKIHISMQSPVPLMQGSAQLMMSHHSLQARPHIFPDICSPVFTPIMTPLALHTAADKAKKLINQSVDGDSPDTSSILHTPSPVAPQPHKTKSPGGPSPGDRSLHITSLSPPAPQAPHPHHTVHCLRMGTSPQVSNKPLLSPGSMALMANLTVTPRAGPHSHTATSPAGTTHVECQVAKVTEKYRETLLDQEVELYTGRVGKRLAMQCHTDLTTRCCDPVSKVLHDGDDTHFVPIHSPEEDIQCVPVMGSTFSHYSIRRI